jgi:hypothetical protein
LQIEPKKLWILKHWHSHLCKFAVGVNESIGKVAVGVNNTGGKLPLVSTTPAVNFPPVSTPSVANNGNNIRLLTP